MHKFLQVLIVLTIPLLSLGQAPQSFNYQGMARDLDGNALKKQDIALEISILQRDASGPQIYQETHQVQTSDHGLFSIAIGEGLVIDGAFDAIDWGNHDHFIRIGMDVTGGNNFETLGVNRLRSVPYALEAGNGSRWEVNNDDIYFSNGSVSIGHQSANPSAILDLQSSDKGLLLPRVSLIQTADFRPLQDHVAGILVYNTATMNDVTPGYYMNDGTRWWNISQSITEVGDLTDEIEKLKKQTPIKRAVFIAGQSNTTFGIGNATIPDFNGKNLSQLGRFGENYQVLPLTFYGTYQFSQVATGGSFGSIFLYHYYNHLKQQYPDREIQLLLIPCGAGGSGWAASQYPNNSWRTDAAYLKDVVSRIKWARNNGYQIDAFLWHQGETDAISQTVNYKDIVKNFIQSIRDYADNQKLPFILGEMLHTWVASNAIFPPYQQILNEVPEEVPYTGTTPADNLTQADVIHFDAKAHVELGQRYFDEYLEALENDAPSNYVDPPQGEHLVYNFNSADGQVFPDIFSAIRFGSNSTETRYSVLGDIWKYKNDDGYYHFRLEIVNGTGVSGKSFEWKQRNNPFGLSEQFFEDRSGSIIIDNSIGINTTGGQGFSSLVYDSRVASPGFTTLFHADTRAETDFWWFSIGQVIPFANLTPIIETNNTVNHVRLYCIKE